MSEAEPLNKIARITSSVKPPVKEGKSIVEKVIEFEKDDEIIDVARELGLDPDGENFEDEDEE